MSNVFRIRVHHPRAADGLVLRTESDWNADLAPVRVGADGTTAEFQARSTAPFLYFKPVLLGAGSQRWAQGDNALALGGGRVADVYPFFEPDAHCSQCSLERVEAPRGAGHRVRVFLPPGYAENTLRRYRVLYLQDGPNLFFPGEAFGGETWKIAETLKLLDAMNLVEPVIAVGVFPNDRMAEYVKPGYAEYGEFFAEVLKPEIDARYRTLPGPRNNAVMGSSLGGVVSFHLAWQYPRLFGQAACLSSTFGYQDDLFARVRRERRRPVRFYLDSGWPHDNYEVTRKMSDLLAARGYRRGVDLLHFAFPGEGHREQAWATRAHLPFQFLFGASGETPRNRPARAASNR